MHTFCDIQLENIPSNFYDDDVSFKQEPQKTLKRNVNPTYLENVTLDTITKLSLFWPFY